MWEREFSQNQVLLDYPPRVIQIISFCRTSDTSLRSIIETSQLIQSGSTVVELKGGYVSAWSVRCRVTTKDAYSPQVHTNRRTVAAKFVPTTVIESITWRRSGSTWSRQGKWRKHFEDIKEKCEESKEGAKKHLDTLGKIQQEMDSLLEEEHKGLEKSFQHIIKLEKIALKVDSILDLLKSTGWTRWRRSTTILLRVRQENPLWSTSWSITSWEWHRKTTTSGLRSSRRTQHSSLRVRRQMWPCTRSLGLRGKHLLSLWPSSTLLGLDIQEGQKQTSGLVKDCWSGSRLTEESMRAVWWVWYWRPARIDWVTHCVTSLSRWRLCLGQMWKTSCSHSDGVPPENAPKALENAEIKYAKDSEDKPVYFMFNNRQCDQRTRQYLHTLKFVWDLTTAQLQQFMEDLKVSEAGSICWHA